MNRDPQSRRRFLQGLGGVSLAAPFLSSLGKRAASAQATGLPKRLVVMFTHHGCVTNRWFPARSHGALTAADYQETTLSPLAPFADKLLMPRGMRAMNEWSFEQTHGQETHYHAQVMGSYFTCCPVDGWSGVGNRELLGVREDVPARGWQARPYGGRSLDHVCAEQLSPSGLPLVLAIGGVEDGEMYNFSYRTPGTAGARAEPFLPTSSVAAVFGDLLGGLDASATRRLLRDRVVLDLVRDDLQRAKAETTSSADKQLLEAWSDLMRDTSKTVAADCTTSQLERLGTTAEALQIGGETYELERHTPAMLNVAVLSALCADNPVIFAKFPAIADFSFLTGIVTDSDGLAHRVGSANLGGTCLDGVSNMLLTIDDWYARQFASLVGKLDAIPEGEGTVLDNCAAVWFQEVSDGGAMNLNNIPVIQAGSCGGYFKTGVAINVDDGAEDLSRGSSESVCVGEAATVTFEQLRAAATPPELANAPINKYFCNLMNAIGVRGDAVGSPSRDGEGPVSRFGYYDDTTAFATFLRDDSQPPGVDDPGEFVQLRATA